jgi:hypothetical protein
VAGGRTGRGRRHGAGARLGDTSRRAAPLAAAGTHQQTGPNGWWARPAAVGVGARAGARGKGVQRGPAAPRLLRRMHAAGRGPGAAGGPRGCALRWPRASSPIITGRQHVGVPLPDGAVLPTHPSPSLPPPHQKVRLHKQRTRQGHAHAPAAAERPAGMRAPGRAREGRGYGAGRKGRQRLDGRFAPGLRWQPKR